MSDTWHLVHTERAALVAALEGLSPEEWKHPSLCPGWTVHDVAGHLVTNALVTPFGLVRAMARARFDFDRQNDEGVRRGRGATPQLTLQRLREVVGRTSGPPAPLDSRLVEEVLHGEDIRRPLGLRHDYATEAAVRSLRYQARTSTAVGGARQVAERVTLRASDADVVLGSGPEVVGPVVSLAMVISGRTTALADLDGPGVDTLVPGR